MTGQKKPRFEYDPIGVSESIVQKTFDDFDVRTLTIIGSANHDMLAILAARAKEQDPPNEIILAAVGSVCASRVVEAGAAEAISLRATIDMCLPDSQRPTQDGISEV